MQFDKLLKQQNVDPSTDPQKAQKIRDDFINSLFQKTGGAGAAMSEAGGMKGLRKIIEGLVVGKTMADVEAEKLGEVMQKSW